MLWGFHWMAFRSVGKWDCAPTTTRRGKGPGTLSILLSFGIVAAARWIVASEDHRPMKHATTWTAQILVATLLLSCACASAGSAGSISGSVKDSTGAVIPNTAVVMRNTETAFSRISSTNDDGLYAFTAIPVGHYEIEVSHSGFKPYKRTGLVIDVDTSLKVDVPLEVGEQSDQVTVLDTPVHIDIESAEMGEVISGTVMTAVALNGRSFTDLLPLQPGIVPMSTQQPDSIVMAGASVAISPSGGLNPGTQLNRGS